MRDNRSARWILYLGCCFLMLLWLAACIAEPAATEAEQATSAVSAQELEDEDDAMTRECPQEIIASDFNVPVDITHIIHLTPPGSMIRFIAGDAQGVFTIHADGSIDSPSGEVNQFPMTISGNLEDCLIEGNMMLEVEFGGLCSDGVMNLKIVEHVLSETTTVTCPGSDPQTTSTEGMFSAPETDMFSYGLVCEYPYDLEAETELMSVYHSWEIHLCDGIWDVEQ